MIIYGLQTVKSFKVTFALKVPLTIYLFYNLCRFALELSPNMLAMIILSFFKVTSTIHLFFNLCRCFLVLSYTRYKHSFIRHTKHKDICNNLLLSAGIINHTEEEYFTISTFLYQAYQVQRYLQ